MISNLMFKITPIDNKLFAFVVFFVSLVFAIYLSVRLLKIFIVRAKLDKIYNASIKGVQHFVDAKHFKTVLLKSYIEQFRGDIELLESLTISSSYYFLDEDLFSVKKRANDIVEAILETLLHIKLVFTFTNHYSSVDVTKTSILLI